MRVDFDTIHETAVDAGSACADRIAAFVEGNATCTDVTLHFVDRDAFMSVFRMDQTHTTITHQLTTEESGYETFSILLFDYRREKEIVSEYSVFPGEELEIDDEILAQSKIVETTHIISNSLISEWAESSRETIFRTPPEMRRGTDPFDLLTTHTLEAVKESDVLTHVETTLETDAGHKFSHHFFFPAQPEMAGILCGERDGVETVDADSLTVTNAVSKAIRSEPSLNQRLRNTLGMGKVEIVDARFHVTNRPPTEFTNYADVSVHCGYDDIDAVSVVGFNHNTLRNIPEIDQKESWEDSVIEAGNRILSGLNTDWRDGINSYSICYEDSPDTVVYNSDTSYHIFIAKIDIAGEKAYVTFVTDGNSIVPVLQKFGQW